MSYHLSNITALGVTTEQQKVLLDIPIDKLRDLPPQDRLGLVLRRQEVKAMESSAMWDAVATFVSVAVPIAAFFGLSWAAKR